MSLFEKDETITGDAIFSPCKRYRYRLDRKWHETKPPMTFVMLNPSTATEDQRQNDPTITRCIGFARREDCGGIVVVNLFALRSTDPKGLKLVRDPVGIDNDAHILIAVEEAKNVVVAWGAGCIDAARSRAVLRLIEQAGATALCLGTTAAGEPRHPLMLRKDAQLIPYRGT